MSYEKKYFSRDDDEAVAILEELNRKGIFFVEERATQHWVADTFPQPLPYEDWFTTNDPDRASKFPTMFHAMTFIIKMKLNPREWYITEHEFVDLSSYSGDQTKIKVARNLVDYEAGLTIFQCATNTYKALNTQQLAFI